MHKRITRTVATLAITAVTSLALVTTTAPADAAQAASKGCVTKPEYKAVKKGWTPAKVHKKFGTKGKRVSHSNFSGYASEIREYKACGSKYSVIMVTFSKNPGGAMKVDGKSAFWL